MIGIKFSRIKIFSAELPSVNKLQLALILLFAIIYALILANFSTSSFEIRDRINYINYARYSPILLNAYLQRGNLLSIVTNEPIWLWINSLLTSFLEPKMVVKTIIFLAAFLSAYSFLRLSPKNFFFIVIFLCFPLILKNYIIHLRQGFAMGIFMFGMLFSNRIRFILCGISPFIHASMFFTIIFMQVDKIINFLHKKPKFSVKIKLVLFSFISLFICLNVRLIAAFFQDRRINQYAFISQADRSGLGWIFWFGVLILMILNREKWMSKNLFSLYAIVFYLVSYFLLEVTARIFESSSFFVLLSSLSLTNYRKILFIMAMMLYGLIQWQGYKSLFFVT